MRALVIGYGSIGLRHTEVLKSLGCIVSIVSKRKQSVGRCFSNISDAINKEKPEYIVIASLIFEKHRPTLCFLLLTMDTIQPKLFKTSVWRKPIEP
jgi:hypothetical protein